MFNLQEFEAHLEVTRILSKRFGIMVYAKQPFWRTEYNFIIGPDGSVKGKTTGGYWLEVSAELRAIIMAKVKALLVEKRNLVYS